LAIKHPFTSLITDIGGPTYIQPTHWNQPHNTPPFRLYDVDQGAASLGVASFGIPSSASYAQLGAAWPDGNLLTSAGGARGQFDFTYVDTISLAIGVASGHGNIGSAGFRFQYMASGFPGSWYSFDATGGSAPFVSVATITNNASMWLASANGLAYSASVTVSAAAKALPQPLTTRLAGFGGNGSAVFIGKIVVLGS
jgi:hypothetical protein